MIQIVLFVSLYTVIGVLFAKMFIKLGRISLKGDDKEYFGIATLLLCWPLIAVGVFSTVILYLIGKAVFNIVK